jgi:flagellar basal body-associated protein FliL
LYSQKGGDLIINNKKIIIALLAIFIIVGAATAVYGFNFIANNQAQNVQSSNSGEKSIDNETCSSETLSLKNK